MLEHKFLELTYMAIDETRRRNPERYLERLCEHFLEKPKEIT